MPEIVNGITVPVDGDPVSLPGDLRTFAEDMGASAESIATEAGAAAAVGYASGLDATKMRTVLDGSNDFTSGLSATNAASIADPTTATGQATRAASVEALGGLTVANLPGLIRWGAARGDAAVSGAVITVVGDSITHGVGSDGSATSLPSFDPTQEGVYFSRAYPQQLRKRLNAAYGLPDAENWVGMRPGWAGGAVLANTTNSAATGPLGSNATGGVGGLALGQTSTVTFPTTSRLGRFTEIDIPYFGTDLAGSAARPRVRIDGVEKIALSGPAAGGLNFATITGLTDDVHEVIIDMNNSSAYSGYVYAANVRRGPAFTVNRMGVSGSMAEHIAGTNTGNSRQRALLSTVMPGITDLLIVAMGTNEEGNQVPLADYKADLQEVIDLQVAGGGCVLLLGEPPTGVPGSPLTETDYRGALAELAEANEHVAFMDVRQVFGTHAQADALGLFPTTTTTHPSGRGHGVMADALFRLLTLPNYRVA